MLIPLSILSPLLPIIIFLFFCVRKSKKELWVIFIYCLLDFVLDMGQSVTSWGREHHFQIYGILNIIEFTLFCSFLYLALERMLIRRIIISIYIVILLLLVSAYLKADRKNFDSILTSIESIAIITLSIIYFFEQINRPVDQSHFVYSSPNFWVVLAFLIYNSGTLFLFILASNLTPEKMLKYWSINNIFNIITNFIFAIAFLICRFSSQNPSLEKTYIDYPDILEKP